MAKWDWINNFLKENNISQAEFAQMVDWSKPRISELVTDKRDILGSKIDNFARVLGVNIEELIAYNKNQTNKIPSMSSLPVTQNLISIDVLDVTACCGNGVENMVENVIGKQMMSLSALRELTPSAPECIKIIKTVGESMAPTIAPNDVVWVDISFTSPTSDGLYLLAVGQELMIKRIQINPFDNSALVKSDNPNYQPIAQNDYRTIRVLGRVIYHMRRMR